MKTKQIGTQHGERARAKIEKAKNVVRNKSAQCVEHGKQVAGYLAGFAQGLLRSPNV
jgi:hypothetical protein